MNTDVSPVAAICPGPLFPLKPDPAGLILFVIESNAAVLRMGDRLRTLEFVLSDLARRSKDPKARNAILAVLREA